MPAKRPLICIAFLVVCATPAAARADLIWQYLSTNGSITVEGLLITTGSPGDENNVGLDLSLISFNTVILNGTDITASSNWANGSGPPFINNPSGQIEVTGAGVAMIDSLSMTLHAEDVTNSVLLAAPGVGNTQVEFKADTVSLHAQFAPTSTTFTFVAVVPEASSFLGVGLVGLALGLGSFSLKKLRPRRELAP